MEMSRNENIIPQVGRNFVPESHPGSPGSSSDSGGSNLMTSKAQQLAQKNPATAQNESYYHEWINEKAARERLEATVALLQKQVTLMQQQMAQKEKGKDDGNAGGHKEYWTDEEELAAETEWVVKGNRSKKKRKMNTSPEISPQKQVAGKNQIKRPPNPPPIIVSRVKDYDKLREELTTQQLSFKATMLNNEQVKLNVTNSDDYRNLRQLLSEGYQWHSYEDKQTRPLRVMVRKLHPTCKPEKITEELYKRGFKIQEAVNILKRKEKTPLPLFMLTFQNGEDVNKVFEITEIQGMRVKIEAIRKSRIIPQCKRCQQHGHTQKFCNKEPRCVKCAGKHYTTNCQTASTSTTTTLKCANCGESHPASYRGCEVAKKMQQLKNDAVKAKKENNTTRRTQNSNSQVQAGKTFAQATKIQEVEIQQPGKNKPIEQMLMNLISRFDQQEQLMKNLSDRMSKLESCSNRATTSKK